MLGRGPGQDTSGSPSWSDRGYTAGTGGRVVYVSQQPAAVRNLSRGGVQRADVCVQRHRAGHQHSNIDRAERAERGMVPVHGRGMRPAVLHRLTGNILVSALLRTFAIVSYIYCTLAVWIITLLFADVIHYCPATFLMDTHLTNNMNHRV